MTDSTPRQRRRRRTRRAILDAALTLIVEGGVENLSLREVARRADYSPAGLYRYFDGKDDIVATLAADGYRRLDRALRRVLDTPDPIERLVALGMAYVDFAHAQPEHFQLIFSRLVSERRSLAEPTGESPYALLSEAVATAVAAGALAVATEEVETVAYNLWSMAHGMAMLQSAHLRGFEADFNAADRRAFHAYLAGLQQT